MGLSYTFDNASCIYNTSTFRTSYIYLYILALPRGNNISIYTPKREYYIFYLESILAHRLYTYILFLSYYVTHQWRLSDMEPMVFAYKKGNFSDITFCIVWPSALSGIYLFFFLARVSIVCHSNEIVCY